METGGFEPFLTEAQLLASTPTISPKAAKALDTGKIWYWGKSEGTTIDAWHDTGLSELDQANKYVDVRALIRTSFMKLFSFEDGNNTPIVNIYKNGSVWIKGLKLDVAAFINSLNTKFDFLNSLIKVGAGKNYFVFNDVNNLPLMKLNQNQDLFIPKIGNLTKTILSLKDKKPSLTGAQSADLVLATLSSKTSSGTLSALTANYVDSLGVFSHAVNLIRIPAITRIQENKFLCFFEARVDQDDFGRNSQGVCTLTVDVENLTVTASNVQALHEVEPHATVADAYYTFMNGCAVKLDSGRIITLYVKRYGTGEHYLYKRYSDNDGETWSEYEDIGTQLNMDFYNLLCPCSQGLVKRYGSFKGRIIFPVWYSGQAYNGNEFRAGYIYSDNDGETWNDGFFNKETLSNEVQCAEDLNGDLLFCIRRELTGDYAKTWSKVYDGEYELTPFQPKQIVSQVNVMSGLIQSKNNFDLSTPKFQYIGTYTTGRKDLKIFTSYDGGANWVNEFDVPNTEIGSIYSCIERLNEYYTFALWENHWANELKCQILSINDLVK